METNKVQLLNIKNETDRSAKIYQCDTCKKILSCSSALRRHEVIHEDLPYKCGLCFIKFIHCNNLKRHMLSSHGKGNTELKCRHCHKSFSRRYSLKRHEAIQAKNH